MPPDLKKQLSEHFRVLGFDPNEVMSEDVDYIVPPNFKGCLDQKIAGIHGDTFAEDAKKVVDAVQFIFAVIYSAH